MRIAEIAEAAGRYRTRPYRGVRVSREGKALKRAIHRSLTRFPEDFMFQLTQVETENLRYQIDTSNSSAKVGHGGARYLTFVFTQEEVAMLSSVLLSALRRLSFDERYFNGNPD